jgi:hypothetical protein
MQVGHIAGSEESDSQGLVGRHVFTLCLGSHGLVGQAAGRTDSVDPPLEQQTVRAIEKSRQPCPILLHGI